MGILSILAAILLGLVIHALMAIIHDFLLFCPCEDCNQLTIGGGVPPSMIRGFGFNVYKLFPKNKPCRRKRK